MLRSAPFASVLSALGRPDLDDAQRDAVRQAQRRMTPEGAAVALPAGKAAKLTVLALGTEASSAVTDAAVAIAGEPIWGVRRREFLVLPADPKGERRIETRGDWAVEPDKVLQEAIRALIVMGGSLELREAEE